MENFLRNSYGKVWQWWRTSTNAKLWNLGTGNAIQALAKNINYQVILLIWNSNGSLNEHREKGKFSQIGVTKITTRVTKACEINSLLSFSPRWCPSNIFSPSSLWTFLLMLISCYLSPPHIACYAFALKMGSHITYLIPLNESSLLHYTNWMFNRHWCLLKWLHWFPKILWGFYMSAEKQYTIAKLLCLYRKIKAWNVELKQMQCQRSD